MISYTERLKQKFRKYSIDVSNAIETLVEHDIFKANLLVKDIDTLFKIGF